MSQLMNIVGGRGWRRLEDILVALSLVGMIYLAVRITQGLLEAWT